MQGIVNSLIKEVGLVINSDEHKLGYIAIGEAVLSHIISDKEISCESLMLMLTKHAKDVTNKDKLSQIWLGHSLLTRARHDHKSLTES